MASPKEDSKQLLDFEKELDKLDFAAVDENFNSHFQETAQLVDAFNATLKRVGKELNHTNLQLEEFISYASAEQEKDALLTRREQAVEASEKENNALVETLVDILDHIEDLYRFVQEKNSSAWAAQVRLLWKNMDAQLLTRGITPIDGEMMPFNANLHEAVHTREDRWRPPGLILTTLRRGYLYRSSLVRKAKVVVNKRNEGDDGNSIDSRD